MKIPKAKRMAEIAEIVQKAEDNPMELSKEDLVVLHSTWHIKEEAEQIAKVYITMKKESPEIYRESIKVDVALATGRRMPPKKWTTSPYFPRR